LFVLFFLLMFLFLILLLVGLIHPTTVLWWWQPQKRTRKRVAKVYGIAALASFILFMVIGPSEEDRTISKKSAEQTKTEASKAEVVTAQSTTSTTSAPVVKVTKVKVKKVIDGDTFETEQGEKVRLIGVNTPETVKEGAPVMPFGPEASAFTKSQIEGKEIYLEADVEAKDQYGRTLAYAYLQEPKSEQEIATQMLNAILIREGYAQLMTIPPNSKYTDLFVKEQKSAREASKGIWALGIYKDSATSTDDVFLEGKNPAKQVAQAPAPEPKKEEPKQQAAAPAPAPEPKKASGKASPSGGVCPPEFPVKGNHSSSGELIYHVPGGAYYNKTNPEECFATPADAQAAGYRASKR
jgi:micrococcal nuclease